MRIGKEPALPGTTIDPLYPSWDGKPMGETDFHSFAILILRESLEDFFASRSDVYVASNLVLYYEKGVPTSRRDPDVLVALGASPHRRQSFRVWEEGRVPNVVFEIASKNTWQEDVGDKVQVYQSLGIREYFLFDPEGAFYNPSLMGYRLARRRYVPIRPNTANALPSEQLGAWLLSQGNELRLIDPGTEQLVPTRRERIAQAEEDIAHAEEDIAQAEEDITRLQEQARQERRLRLQAERATRQAQQQAQREQERIAELEAEVRRLREGEATGSL